MLRCATASCRYRRPCWSCDWPMCGRTRATSGGRAFAAPPSGRKTSDRLLDLIEPVARRIADADQCRRVRLQRRLAAHQVVKLLLELLLVEQLATGGAVDAGAQFGDAVFVGVLLFGLPRDQTSEKIVAESEIGRGRDRPAGHDDDRADKDPKRDRSESNLPSGMGDGVACTYRYRLACAPLRADCFVRPGARFAAVEPLSSPTLTLPLTGLARPHRERI